MHACTEYESPCGTLTIASDGGAVCGLWFENHKYLDESLPKDARRGTDAVLAHLAQWLDAYFAGKRPAIDELPLAPVGTSFRQDVWRALRDIPYGQTVSYGELAQQ